MVAVRRAPSGAPVSELTGLLTCVRLPPIRLVATDGSSLNEFGVVHEKIVPDPPAFTLPDAAGCTPESLDRAAANRALDYYLTDHRPVRIAGSCTYAIPNSVNLEAALAQASDLLRCMGATANEAGNGLHGAQRDVVLSIVHLAELARAYVDKSLDCLVTH